jgi:hypothetical protein
MLYIKAQENTIHVQSIPRKENKKLPFSITIYSFFSPFSRFLLWVIKVVRFGTAKVARFLLAVNFLQWSFSEGWVGLPAHPHNK